MPSYVPIITIRGTSTVIDDTPVHDGQILFDESRKCLFMDNGNTRNKYSGLGADSNVATVEDTTTSTHAYAKGDYVVVEGQLYEVTAAIAVGDTFSVGTNVSVTTVGDELVQIKSDLSNLSKHNYGTEESLVADTAYTAPSDGYVVCRNNSNASATAQIKTASNGVTLATMTLNPYTTTSVFIRKGTSVYPSTSNGGTVTFIPLI